MKKAEEKEFPIIYENAKKSSIGKEKKCKDNRFKKKIALTVSTVALTAALALSGVACSNMKLGNYKSSLPYDYVGDDYYGVSKHDIHYINLYRLTAFIEANGLNYKIENNFKRSLNYTAEDYKKMKGLVDGVVICFYDWADEQSFNNVLNALGYADFDEYLSSKGYVGYDRETNIQWWRIDCYNEIAEDEYGPKTSNQPETEEDTKEAKVK